MNFGSHAVKNGTAVFLLTLNILFRLQSIAHTISGIKVARYGESKWVYMQLRFEAPKDFNLAMALRLVALSVNALLNAIILSF